ncbi:hypothetical protein BU23DRAFT_539164 [Bimuria novae-zelandiae CBS 107.79]|uniref:Chromatin assembly factor 1 subunit A n=1 Tax=Bimuria novae-zelandiae CBS 107.79 TaxID=1447943 RepID=A0A6A5UY91_9PLEO|nr:hypothetical protein BU23DRAFT_539164 [Bimuria novae-zelandiae CBS 107.79]
MAAPLPVPVTSPQKRPHVDDVEPSVSTPLRCAPSNASTPLTIMSSLDTPSPLKYAKTDAVAMSSSTGSVAGGATGATQPTSSSSGSIQQPAKRRKLTPQEKEEQAKEKEAKAQARAEQKAQRDEEKRLKDEEKRKKNEEKEEKKRAKELKQQQEEETKRKKEQSQMRLNAFFTKPKAAAEPAGNTTVEPVQRPAIGQTSLSANTVVTSANSAPPSPQKAVLKNAQSDYERTFLPFSLPSTSILAPSNALLNTPDALAAAQSRLDSLVSHKDVDMDSVTLEPIQSVLPKRQRGLETTTMVEIVERVNGSADNPIDLTKGTKSKPLDLLKAVPMKYLHFGEDVRPPYFGTYTKLHDPAQERKVARNPIYRGLSDLNYDYDSEAEWEEPGEGEDLDSEGEEDLEEDGEEDLDGFLDDEEDPDVKRRLLNGDQDPISTGLCWEDSAGVSRLNDGSGTISTEFKNFQMCFLLQTQQPIDPFSDAYWAPEPLISRSTIQAASKEDQSSGAMNPPRLPLSTRPINGLLNTLNGSQKAPATIDAKSGKPKRTIPANLLPEFKAEVEGSDLTKIGLIEALKKRFPKVPKDALTNTLTEVAQRIGPSAAEKRWVLLT